MTEHLLRMHKAQGLIHSAKLKEKEKEKGREGGSKRHKEEGKEERRKRGET